MIVKVYKMNMLIKNEIKPVKMVLLDDYNELNQRTEKALNKINNKEYEIEAKTDVTIIFMEMHFILNPKNTSSQIYSQFLINLLELLNKKYTEASQRLDILTNKTIRNKLLEYFKNSYQETNARVLYLKSSFTALADYLAVDRSAMTRELKNLKDEGLIEIKNKKIKLLYFPLD